MLPLPNLLLLAATPTRAWPICGIPQLAVALVVEGALIRFGGVAALLG